MSTTVSIRKALSQDMLPCARIYNAWVDSTGWMPRVRSVSEVEANYHAEVYSNRKTLVAVGNGLVMGFMTLADDDFISAHYVDARSRGLGIGGLLLEKVKREQPAGLQLFTFQANDGAQRFYKRHGFVQINHTDGDNEESLPDVLMEWREP